VEYRAGASERAVEQITELMAAGTEEPGTGTRRRKVDLP
jgi:hypothetical protein